MSKNSNSKNTALDRFIQAGLNEIDLRAKGEIKGSLALAYALLSSDDPDTLDTWKVKLRDLNNDDDKLREVARAAFAEYIGASVFVDSNGDKERKTQDYRNLVMRQTKRMQFAIDVHEGGIREHIIVRETAKGIAAHIKGETTLASRVWASLKWNDRKNMAERSPSMDILISQRSSTTQRGEISWSKLADLVAGWNNRKQANSTKPVTISAAAPLGAVKALQSIINADPNKIGVHFTNVESKMVALETAEDIAAFAVEGDDEEMTALRRQLNDACEAVRSHLQSLINRKQALMNKEAA